MSRNAGAPGAESPVRLAGPSAWRPIPVPHRLGQANRIEQFMTMRYVVGFDGSGPSEAALAWTIHRARHEPAPIVLVHVAEGDDGAMGEEYEDLATRCAGRTPNSRSRASPSRGASRGNSRVRSNPRTC
jgi:hypothetical protein